MKQKIHLLKRSSFPSHSFFDHLLRGTEYYRSHNFERAAEEWGEAGWLNYETPINIRRNKDRIFLGGFIREVPFLFFLYAVYTNKVNGIGAIKANGVSKNLVFQEGRLVKAATNRREERIGNIILQKERLTPATLDMLVNDAAGQGKKIGQYLVEKGLLSLDALQEVLSLQMEQILVDIILWQRGYFYFFERPIGQELIVDYDPLNLTRIATYRGLSLEEFQNKIPNRKLIFRPSPYAETRQEDIRQKLTDSHKFIFSLIDGTRNIEQLARFSGINEKSVIEILHRLNTAGMIRRSKEIIEYEDKQYNEISNILDTLLEIYSYLLHLLIAEIGSRSRHVVQRALAALNKNHKAMFADMPLDNPERVRKEMVFKNMAFFYPEPAQRHLFIEAFCELIGNLRAEISRFLGGRYASEATVKIRTEVKNIERYAKETALRSHLLETFDRLSE
jgi:DNA-binding Lrp family transcriptional regulator